MRTLPTALMHAAVAANLIPGLTPRDLTAFSYGAAAHSLSATAPDGAITLNVSLNASRRRRDGPPITANISYSTPGGVNVTLVGTMTAPDRTPLGTLSIPGLLRGPHVPATIEADERAVYVTPEGEVLPMTITAVFGERGDPDQCLFGITDSGRQLMLPAAEWAALLRPDSVPSGPWTERRSAADLDRDLTAALTLADLPDVTFVRRAAQGEAAAHVQIITGPTTQNVDALLHVREDELPLLTQTGPDTFQFSRTGRAHQELTGPTAEDIQQFHRWFRMGDDRTRQAIQTGIERIQVLSSAGRQDDAHAAATQTMGLIQQQLHTPLDTRTQRHLLHYLISPLECA